MADKLMRPATAQQGFTLIELIVVIVILGVLAATALPQFIDARSDARVAKMQGYIGGLNSAIALTTSKWNLQGQPPTLTLDDGSVITFVNGYPAASSIGFLLQSAVKDTKVVSLNGTVPAGYAVVCEMTKASTTCSSTTACSFRYNNAATPGADYQIDTTHLNTAECS